uniref:Uncharacterized protein n=1 Tax=Paraburkholderia sprentiae WSM5005 TaxID=754502 RepID=A0A1I9YVB5_9BURK
MNGGRRQAVGGDIVLCKCADHPRIVAIYGRIWKIADRSGETSVPIATAPVQNLIFDEQVRAVAARASLAGYPYYIETESGDVYSGRIDSHGFLPRITTDGAEHYVIYWGDEALARKDWN